MSGRRKLFSGLVALCCVVVLSSCALVSFGPQGGFYDDSNVRSDARMEQIADAVNSHDAAALKARFSPPALEKATEIDERLEFFLSFFPNGGLTWERSSISPSGHNSAGEKTELVSANYKVAVDGNDYWLFFADFTVNELENPDNVGLYALGVTPWTDDPRSGPAEPFRYWTGSIYVDETDEDGYPGVYVPPGNSELSLQKMAQIVGEVNTQDNSGLRERLTEYAQAEYATELDQGIEELYALFPKGDVVWDEDQQAVPVVRESADNGDKTVLLISDYRVSSGAGDYWLSFAYFPDNTLDPANLGIYAIGVAPLTESGDSPAEAGPTPSTLTQAFPRESSSPSSLPGRRWV